MKQQPSDETFRDHPDSKQLECGHWTTFQPIAIYPSQRKLYECPQGCGLVKDKPR